MPQGFLQKDTDTGKVISACIKVGGCYTQDSVGPLDLYFISSHEVD
jgi:hypothetical protein